MLAAMNFRESLAHAWVTIGVPGTTHPRTSTYVLYPEDGLPPLPVALFRGDGLGWLRGLPAVRTGMTPDEWSHTTTPLSREGTERLLRDAGASPGFERLPADLRAFASETELQRRLFSATDAYIDAGERLEPVQGGRLLHLISDSQWVFHWLAFIGDDGSTGVVCSAAALGYSEDADDDGAPARGADEAVWVADSVAEFIWRWWADNYAFAAAHPDHCPPLSAPDWFDLAAYTAGYTAPGIEPS